MAFESKKVDKLLDCSEYYFINELGMSKKEYLNFYRDYLIEYNGKYYFSKKIYNEFLYNEIIGRYLCSKVNLDTTDLIIEHKGIFKSKILTPNYHNKDYINFRPEDNFEYGMKTKSFDDSCFEYLDASLQDDLFKLIAVDLMMEQIDRYARNMEVFVIDDTLRLAPIIDFELAFYNQRRFTYFNPYILIRKDVRILDSFYDKYPEGYNYFAKIFKTGTNELIDHVKDEYNLETKRLVKKDIRCTVRRNHNILRELQG